MYVYIYVHSSFKEEFSRAWEEAHTQQCVPESHCRQGSSTLQHAVVATTLVSGAAVLSAPADAQGTRCYQLKRLVHSQREAKNTIKHANKTKALMFEWGTSSFWNYCSVKLYEASKGMGTYKLSSELLSDIKVHGLVPATIPNRNMLKIQLV